MRVYYLTAAGRALLEHVPPRFRMVEFLDGYHILSNDCIWRPSAEDGEATVFVFQGRSTPVGGDPSRVRFVMKETNRLRDNRQSVRVSLMWTRYLILAIKYIAVAAAVFFALYGAYVYEKAV